MFRLPLAFVPFSFTGYAVQALAIDLQLLSVALLDEFLASTAETDEQNRLSAQ